MNYYILRNNQRFGPYDSKALAHYVVIGQILLQDMAIQENGLEEITVRMALKNENVKAKANSNFDIIKQIRSLGVDLLFPRSAYSVAFFKNDKKLMLMSIIGLAPAFVIKLTGLSYFTFYAIALYFSLIWGLFFYYVFKTVQVRTKATILVFFITQALIFLLVDVFHFTEFNPLYRLTESELLLGKLSGYILGVGIFEELVKALPLYYLGARSAEPQQPQTMVFYGLISGIGFGVFEGVLYQININSLLGYSESFFLNIARLTSLPFLHAIWAGIAGYFISLSYLFPNHRQSLRILSVFIPAILHGLYDTMGWSLLGLVVSCIAVGLLIVYLQKAKDFQQKLSV